jgi:hypothetical protein
MRFFSFVTPVLALCLLAGCARSPVTPDEPVQPPTVRRILVIPVTPIAKLHTENKGIPIGVLWQSIADRIKSSDFNDRMETMRKDMGSKLTAALVKQLRTQGYEAEVIEGIRRPASSPDNIDYTRLPVTDPVLHIYFNEVGMYSARFSMDYVPRVNLSAYLIRPQDADTLYGETIYYGADSRGNASWSVPADARHRWASFDEMVGKPQEVTGSYDAAVEALAARIAQNIREQFAPAPARVSSAP